MAILATAGLGVASGIAQGQQQKHAYELQAGQAKLQAESQVVDRTRALNEAMANQNAMMGSSGRTLESASSVMEGDKVRYKQDTDLIRASGGAQSSQYKMAGSAAQAQGSMNALNAGAKGAMQYSMIS